MKTAAKISKLLVIAALALWVVPTLFLARVEPNEIGVRQSAAGTGACPACTS